MVHGETEIGRFSDKGIRVIVQWNEHHGDNAWWRPQKL